MPAASASSPWRIPRSRRRSRTRLPVRAVIGMARLPPLKRVYNRPEDLQEPVNSSADPAQNAKEEAPGLLLPSLREGLAAFTVCQVTEAPCR